MVGCDSSCPCRVLGWYPRVEQVGVALEAEWGDITLAPAERLVERDRSRLRISLDLWRNPRERERDYDRRRNEQDGGESLCILPPTPKCRECKRDRGEIRSADDEIHGRPPDPNRECRAYQWVAHYARQVQPIVRDHEPDYG